MKKIAILVPLAFVAVGACFTTYSFLDTFIIVKHARSVDIDNNSSFSFTRASYPTRTSNSNSSKSSSKPFSFNSIPSEPGEYYEDKTEEEINALFTTDVVFREKEHYSDPNIYIDITTHRDEEDTTTYYVADIRLKSLENLKTALAKDTFGENINERTSDICKRKKGILAIDGDTYGSQEGGYVVRNGKVLRTTKNLNRGRKYRKSDDLVIYGDGTFEIFDEATTDLQTIVDKGAWQVFSFGPGLVINGAIAVREDEEVGTAMQDNRNQRCAIGIIAPLHYVFVVSDGRSNESFGLSLFNIANIMKDLHCMNAYNLDGGGSATMYMDDGTGNANGHGHLVNKPTQDLYGQSGTVGQREVSDIVYIGK